MSKRAIVEGASGFCKNREVAKISTVTKTFPKIGTIGFYVVCRAAAAGRISRLPIRALHNEERRYAGCQQPRYL